MKILASLFALAVALTACPAPVASRTVPTVPGASDPAPARLYARPQNTVRVVNLDAGKADALTVRVRIATSNPGALGCPAQGTPTAVPGGWACDVARIPANDHAQFIVRDPTAPIVGTYRRADPGVTGSVPGAVTYRLEAETLPPLV